MSGRKGKWVDRDSILQWRWLNSDCPELKIELPLTRILDLSDRLIRFSLDDLLEEFAEGYTLSMLDASEADATTAWATGVRYQLRTPRADLFCQAGRDREDGGNIIKVRRLHPRSSTRNLPTGPARLVTPVFFYPLVTIHVPPWIDLPPQLGIWEELGTVGGFVSRQDESNCLSLFLPASGAGLELLPLAAQGEEPMNYLLQGVHRQRNDVPLGGIEFAPSCFSVEWRMPLVLPPEMLDDPVLGPVVLTSRATKGRDAGSPTRARRRPIAIEDFDHPLMLRAPADGEVDDFSEEPHGVPVKSRHFRNGTLALDYSAEWLPLTVIARPTVSELSGRPFLAVVRIIKRSGKPVRHQHDPEPVQLDKGAVEAVCTLAIELPYEIEPNMWRSDAQLPTVGELIADWRMGFTVERLEKSPGRPSDFAVYSYNFAVFVQRESSFPREPAPGTPLVVPTIIRESKRPPRVQVKPGLHVFEPPLRLSTFDLLPMTSEEQVEPILNDHYLFASTYSDFLDYRDAGIDRHDDPAKWSIPAHVLGRHDVSGRSFPEVSERIAQEVPSEKAALLVALRGHPERGVFIDGCLVEANDKNGKATRYTIDVVSGDCLLLRPQRAGADFDTDVVAADFTCPYEIGAEIVLIRRPPQLNIDLKRQVDDLRKGRNLAASHKDFAEVVTTPHRLRGQFEPGKTVTDLMAEMERRKRHPMILNKEQKTAVSRAARTPHAYFIKGPPGTGKTQVISELIKLLSARGERILLASAQNKPLAEAIDRVADVDGVLAARITGRNRPDLSKAEKLTVWDNIVDALVKGLNSGGVPEETLKPEDRQIRAIWRGTMGLDTEDDTRRRMILEDLVEGCLSDINLYAININAIATRLNMVRDRRATAGRPNLRPQPDFHTAFDTLIVDEASRVTDAEFVTAALRCRRWILVGDERQLPPFVDDNDSCYFHALCALFLFDSAKREERQDGATESVAASSDVEATSPPDDDTVRLRVAVEQVENLWLSGGDREQFEINKVIDLAGALHSQRALDRCQDGSLADPSLRTKRMSEMPLRQRLLSLAYAMVDREQPPPRPDADADTYVRQQYDVDLRSYRNRQVQELQRAFSTFVMRSFFERGYGSGERRPEDDGQSSSFRTTLKTQYRMVAEIADLVSGAVYEGQYLTSDVKDPARVIQPLVIPTFPRPAHFVDMALLGRLADCTSIGTGWANAAEAEHVVEILRTLGTETPADDKVSILVLSIYKKQTNLMERRFNETFSEEEGPGQLPGLVWPPRFSNVDGAQGSEADVVVISLVRMSTGGLPDPKFAIFLQDLRRLNVAITRAKRKIIFVGHSTTVENLCGNHKAAEFLAWLLSPDSGIERRLPYRLSEAALRDAKKRLDDDALRGLDEDGDVIDTTEEAFDD